MKLNFIVHRLGLLMAALAVALAVSTGAATASGVTSITTTLAGQIPSAAPFMGTATGTFTANTTNGPLSGTVSAQLVLPAPPPNASQIETFRTYTSSDGKSTLKLRCSEIARPGSSVFTGHCAVLDASGAFAGLRGSATVSGVTDAQTSPPTLEDTILF